MLCEENTICMLEVLGGFQTGQGCQCPLATVCMIDAWGRVVLVEFDTTFTKERRGGFPGPENPFGRKIFKRWNPLLCVLTPGIELLALSNGVENSKVGSGISSATGGPLPSVRTIIQDQQPQPSAHQHSNLQPSAINHQQST